MLVRTDGSNVVRYVKTQSKIKRSYYRNLRYFPCRRNSESPDKSGGSKVGRYEVDSSIDAYKSRNSSVVDGWKQHIR